MADEQNSNAQNAAAAQFEIERIYIKDISLETPNVPKIFREKWDPKVKLDLDIKNSLIDEENSIYEVVLRVTVTNKIGDKVAFLCEVNQAGLFRVNNFDEKSLQHVLNAFIPNILYPYARESIASLIGKASFPPYYIAPINFEAVYAQRLKQKATAATNSSEQKQDE